jgi:hypothetical protein
MKIVPNKQFRVSSFLLSEKNNAIGQDQKILTDEQATLESNKGAPEP